MAFLALLVLVILALPATALLVADGNRRRAAKLVVLSACGAVLVLAGLFALEWLERMGGSTLVVVSLFCLVVVGIRFVPSALWAVWKGSKTPTNVLSVVAGSFMLLGLPYMLGPGYAPVLGLFFFLLAVPPAVLAIVTARVSAWARAHPHA